MMLPGVEKKIGEQRAAPIFRINEEANSELECRIFFCKGYHLDIVLSQIEVRKP
jgi:hypothetical protein